MEIDLESISLEYIFVALLVAFFLTLLVYLIYSGLLTSITVSTEEPLYGPMTVAYKVGRGSYKGCGVIFTESYSILPHREQVGLYYDDPEGVASEELRYAVGPILAKGDEKASKEEVERMKSYGFKIIHFPKPSFVVTTVFPFTTTLSIYLGIYRVYPRLRDYIAERNLCAYPAMEVYTDSQILFIMPLSKQDEFFVPEFQEEDTVSIATSAVSLAGVEGDDTESSVSRLDRDGSEIEVVDGEYNADGDANIDDNSEYSVQDKGTDESNLSGDLQISRDN